MSISVPEAETIAEEPAGDELTEYVRTIPQGTSNGQEQASRFCVLWPIAWAAVFLLAMEVGVEVRAYRNGYKTLLMGQGHRPVTLPPVGHTAVLYGPTTEFPFRSRILSPKNPASPLQVWIASSSQADDPAFHPSEIFPGVVESRLAQQNLRCDVLNVSRRGAALLWNVGQLQKYGDVWNPDVIVMYQMSNDISLITKRQARERRVDLSKNVEETPAAEPGEGAVPLTDWSTKFVESTTLYELLKTKVTGRINTQKILSDDIGDAGAQKFEADVRSLISETRKRGVRLVLCTFVTSHNRATLSQIPDEYVSSIMRFTPTLSMAGWMTSIERLNAVIVHVGKSEHVSVLDLRPILDGHPEYFRDFVHFTKQGHVVLADAIARHLLTAIDKRGGGSP